VTGGDEDGDHHHPADWEHVLGHVLDAGHELSPEDVPRLVAAAAASLGASDAQLYLASVAQRILVPMPLRRDEDVEPLDIDSTLAGRAFQSSVPTGTDGDGDVWIPVRDGVDRLGVLRLRLASHDEDTLRAARRLASLAADLVVAKSKYSDLFEQVRRRKPLELAAELQRQLLPPSTFRTPKVSVAGVLEPAYEVAGDSFDYALNADLLSAAVFDGVGHDLTSAVMATLAVGAYRNARRNRLDLAETATMIDQALRSQFGNMAFVTGALMQVDVSTGAVQWLNAGHPRPLLLRSGRVVRTLGCPPRAPLGVPCDPGELASEQLEPGDALLLFTDGIVEARSSGGQAFGFHRLADFFERAAAARLEPAETMRRLVHDVIDHHGGVLQDDATCVLVEWRSH
jgi:serine phosphatase RsbU (regulator of sigma subunit)